MLSTNLFFNERLIFSLNFIEELGPDILLGMGYEAAYLLKSAAPEKRLLFLTNGCERVEQYIVTNRVKDANNLNDSINRTIFAPKILNQLENKTVEISDLIVVSSDLIKQFFHYFYESKMRKIYSDIICFGEWIYKDALDYSELKRPFSERNIDMIYVVSSWTRPEKNYSMVRKIVSIMKCLNIHIVGEVDKLLPKAKHHGLITNREYLFSLLGNTKTVVCTSLFDPAPGILYEASAFDCNIVASKNCGNWQICNENLLVDPYSIDKFIEKISLSLKNRFVDNMDYFIKSSSLKNLIDIILVF